ncbi:mobilization protein [Streptacidiphilus sp. P02-A3a]|uniref:relaxase/mobilization nuclease domain-containing protein n=1 Tax=Streptacidiphilus sp. P02-A3a TaxID=2704468 RepID=UPI0015F7D418|nr:mobilization protein [Streptacidiphilus sp. P02-A3a]QMU67125.1 mobilization protein [Streptacidiphilus sp. P02-A3a]
MVPDVSTGDRTRGLLSYLFGPGRRDEHTDPHIVAAFAMPGLPDPGRAPGDQHHELLSELAHYLDQPVRVREQRTGKKVPQHVWHCPVRTAPGDRYLTDEEWAQVARRVVHATGIAPDGDDAACRWIAVRHADDHIHIMATSVREDGRRPRTNRDGQRAQAECRKIEAELGLRRLKSGDFTPAPTPTSAEQAKALRTGKTETAREWLRDQAYAAAAAAGDEADYFSTLGTLGIQIKYRLGPLTGEVTGYGLAAPDDTNGQHEPVYFSGYRLAPDLSINRLRERLNAHDAADQPTARTTGVSPWHRANTVLRDLHTTLLDQEADGGTEQHGVVQAQAAAFSELLHNAAATAPAHARAELRAAATAFNRANRSAVRAEHASAKAVRTAAKELLHTLASDKDGGAAAALLGSAVFVVIALARWHESRGHQQQTAATRQTLAHLQSAYQQAAGPVLADLAARTPTPQATERLATALRATVPEHADRILADPAWPALATTLAKAESAGQNPRHTLTTAAQQRELDTADHPAEVLNWRIQQQTTEHQVERHTARVRAANARPNRNTPAGAASANTTSSTPPRTAQADHEAKARRR